MDRRRDIPPEDRYGNGGGQSYRPGALRDRSPRRDRDGEGYGNRSPPRRPYDVRGPPRGRSRSPPPPLRDDFRRRSPSPRSRFGRGFQRSPRDERRDPRDERDFRGDRDFRDDRRFGNRSPPRFRDRSPPNNGGRDASPMSNRGRRTPPGPRRDRSPPRRFDGYGSSMQKSPPRRQFTPPRGPARDFADRPRSPPRRPEENGQRTDRRLRSPSPSNNRNIHNYDNGGIDSNTTSRRSSPPVHTSRLALMQDNNETRSGRPSPRYLHDERDQHSQAGGSRQPSPSRDRDGDYKMNEPSATGPKLDARSSAADELGKAPSAPSLDRAPPTGPAAGISGFAKPVVVPPSGPRGDTGSTRGGFAPRGRGGYAADYSPRGRGGYPVGSRDARPPPTSASSFKGGAGYDRDPSYQSPAPPGPRNFTTPVSRPSTLRTSSYNERVNGPPSDAPTPKEPRSNTALTANQSPNLYRRPTEPGSIPSGPASDRLRETRRPEENGLHPALRDLPEIVPGGKKLPPVVDRSRLNKLEEEAEKLRRAIYDKDAQKRKSLRDWDRLVREGESAAFRSEIAEAAVRAFDTDGDRVGAAF